MKRIVVPLGLLAVFAFITIVIGTNHNNDKKNAEAYAKTVIYDANGNANVWIAKDKNLYGNGPNPATRVTYELVGREAEPLVLDDFCSIDQGQVIVDRKYYFVLVDPAKVNKCEDKKDDWHSYLKVKRLRQ